jgi:hypothetical protein
MTEILRQLNLRIFLANCQLRYNQTALVDEAFQMGMTLDQNVAVDDGTLCTIPPRNSNH